MRAAVYSRYGPPDVVQIKEVEKPVPNDGEVLIAVRAASVNPMDVFCVRGTPFLARIATGLRKPKRERLGVDVAGRVEAIGRNVTQFKPGDDVFGVCRGAFAEYACAPETALAMKPAAVTFEQAAAAPVAAVTALQGLRDRGLQAGQRVLINGAAGGVGTFAVQIARSYAADVTAVCSTRNMDMVRTIGADRVIDYTKENFTDGSERYDLILDCVGNHPLRACIRVLKAGGIYLMVGGQIRSWIDPLPRLLGALVLSRFVSRKLVVVMAKSRQADLVAIGELMSSGKVTPVIDRRYPLSQTAEAIRYLEGRHARGKVIITLEPEGTP